MKNWNDALVGPDDSLERAVTALDKGALRIALVVDAQRRLLGTITDGDVRRALLRHLPMSASVREVMCSTPQTARPNWPRERVLAIMQSRQLLHLPVVDADNVLVGLETMQELVNGRRLDNPVFLMAGGFGTRLHPLTNDCPKPLLKVGDKPILELILESYISAGFHKFFISTHYLPEMIRTHFGDGSRWGVTIRYVHEETPLGTGGALGLLPPEEIELPMFLMNGDLLTRLDYRGLLDYHNEHGGSATMCVREYEFQVPYGVIQSDGQRILSMVEKPVQKWFINAGIYVLSPELIRSVPANQRVDMPTLLERSIEMGADVMMFPVHEYWLDIGRMEDFKRAQQQFGNL